MSLAVGRMVGSLVAGLLLWHWSPLPYRFGWDPSVARALLRFGAPLAVASVVVFASAYADQVIVGALVGAQALGFYVLAFNLASWPVSIFSQPLRAVAPAAFSRLQHDRAAMSHNLTRLLALLSAVALPACLAISGAAAPVIAFVYGSAWAPSADILLWLALLAALRIWFELAYDYLVVLSRSGRVLAIQAGWFIVGVPAMLLGQRLAGAPGVALAQTLVAAVVVAPAYAVALAAVGVRPVRAAAAVAAPVVAGAATWAVCWWLAGTIGSALVASVSSAAVSLAVMAALVAWHRDAVRGLRGAPA